MNPAPFAPNIERLAACLDLDSSFDAALDSLSALFGYDASFVMVPDEEGKRLFTQASHGYPRSGAGSELWIGSGILGIAAERRTPIRTMNMTVDKLLARAVRWGGLGLFPSWPWVPAPVSPRSGVWREAGELQFTL